MLRRSRTPSVALALVLTTTFLAACSKKKEAPAAAAAPPFRMRDLAAATALDARLVRVTLLSSDVQAALAPASTATPAVANPAKPTASPAAYVGALEAAVASAEGALAAVTHPADRLPAQAAVAAAREYADRLAAVAKAAAPGAQPPAPGAQAELFGARDRLGAAIAGYRAARASWRLDAPEPQGAERELAEARRDMERTEAAFGARTRVAPREEGHEFDPAAVKMTGLMAAERAKAAAAKLPPGLQASAAQYASAEQRAIEAVSGLAQAPEAERAAISRRYHEAKAEALAALADYFAALAAR